MEPPWGQRNGAILVAADNYYGEIHRYYQERSQASRKPGDPPPYRQPPAILKA